MRICFSFYDSNIKKQVNLTKPEIRKRFGRDIVHEDDAKDCLKLLSAKFETEKVRVLRRLEWQSKYYSFAKLADLNEEKQKKKAPNSWQNNCFYLRHYVLYFFLKNRRKLKWRPWHCLRHSRGTFLIGQTSDSMLSGIWLGQSSPRTLEKYNHLYQAITRAAKANTTTRRTLNLKRVD